MRSSAALLLLLLCSCSTIRITKIGPTIELGYQDIDYWGNFYERDKPYKQYHGIAIGIKIEGEF